MKLPKKATQGSKSDWIYNAWIIENDLRKKYMVGFIVSTIVNLILFGVLVT